MSPFESLLSFSHSSSNPQEDTVPPAVTDGKAVVHEVTSSPEVKISDSQRVIINKNKAAALARKDVTKELQKGLLKKKGRKASSASSRTGKAAVGITTAQREKIRKNKAAAVARQTKAVAQTEILGKTISDWERRARIVNGASADTASTPASSPSGAHV